LKIHKEIPVDADRSRVGWRRALSNLIRQAAIRVVAPITPDSILVRGAYRAQTVPPKIWDDEYGSGRWSYLKGLGELGRYSIIVGYCGFFKPGGTVLDVGCGEGILQQKLALSGYRRYLGIDLSETALAKATPRVDARTEFRLGNIEAFTPEGKFDIIVFNEMLYYCADPAAAIRRLAGCLEPGGVMIASIYTARVRRNALQIWRMIEDIGEVIDSTTMVNRETWTVKVFQPTKIDTAAIGR
jgi:2-polyprenyl-3-methyl-5-hydroxy-6-metoxy-1,4-benzoquinol methylase